MAKIIKHTFKIPNLTVKDGELVEGAETSVTYQFTLLFKGIGLYEEIAGKPLLNSLMATVKEGEDEAAVLDKVLDKKLIKDLASASYIKIVGDKFHNNRATVEEFRKSQVYPIVENDYEFVTKLLSMAMECVYDQKNDKGKKTKGTARPKK